jgi:hypothetical protein
LRSRFGGGAGRLRHRLGEFALPFDILRIGTASARNALGRLITSALIGNVIGGTGLFALLAYAQVCQEL